MIQVSIDSVSNDSTMIKMDYISKENQGICYH